MAVYTPPRETHATQGFYNKRFRTLADLRAR